ncbi:unnamed protein product [Spirodela intermedia]|uniref:Uncharacterized protein n=1 Tax=Spirodela intermedia TaxID=51605 RepID=A0A7I8JN13_SPIIN|nr:unnamed protein product [Spirodela intermedia]CAA6671557.1 unnamed protein product [Spirodela intermedia]
MSGAQGAQPMGSPTATTYESVEGGDNRTAMGLKSREDEGEYRWRRRRIKPSSPPARAGPCSARARRRTSRTSASLAPAEWPRFLCVIKKPVQATVSLPCKWRK